ncbi:hypothetical protein ACJJTC_002744 [Scirpophaga incertulas]
MSGHYIVLLLVKYTMSDLLPDITDSCKSIKCVAVDDPICVKLKHQRREFSNLTTYIHMINKCELGYMKCHKDLDAVIVPMKYCEHQESLLLDTATTPGRRVKRSAAIDKQERKRTSKRRKKGRKEKRNKIRRHHSKKKHRKRSHVRRIDKNRRKKSSDNRKNKGNLIKKWRKMWNTYDNATKDDEIKNSRRMFEIKLFGKRVYKDSDSENSHESSNGEKGYDSYSDIEATKSDNDVEPDVSNVDSTRPSCEGEDGNDRNNNEGSCGNDVIEDVPSDDDDENNSCNIDKPEFDNEEQAPDSTNVQDASENSSCFGSEEIKKFKGNENSKDIEGLKENDGSKEKDGLKEIVGDKETDLNDSSCQDGSEEVTTSSGKNSDQRGKKSPEVQQLSNTESACALTKEATTPVQTDAPGTVSRTQREDYTNSLPLNYNIPERAVCKKDCPPSSVMVCARCVHGVYRTFLSVCHVEQYACNFKGEMMEMVSQHPCVLSAPYFIGVDKIEPNEHKGQDNDKILQFIYCREKGYFDTSRKNSTFDPQCNIFNKNIVQEHLK